MSRINFLKLIIASPSEELAKCICFEPGLNVITSNRENGNDLGKSVIAKSLYHCMGAAITVWAQIAYLMISLT